MSKRRTRRVAQALFVGWGLAGGFAEPLGAESPDDARTAEAVRPVLTAPAAVTIPVNGTALPQMEHRARWHE